MRSFVSKRAPREAKLCGSGGFERCEGDQRYGQPEHLFKPIVGDTLYLCGRHEIGYQCDRRLAYYIYAQDTDTADLYEAGNLRRCSYENLIVCTTQQGLVIGDETGAAINQA